VPAANAEITRHDLITRSAFPPFFSSIFLQDRRTLNNLRSMNAIRCQGKKSLPRDCLISERIVARVCVSFAFSSRGASKTSTSITRGLICSRVNDASARVTSRRRIAEQEVELADNSNEGRAAEGQARDKDEGRKERNGGIDSTAMHAGRLHSECNVPRPGL